MPREGEPEVGRNEDIDPDRQIDNEGRLKKPKKKKKKK